MDRSESVSRAARSKRLAVDPAVDLWGSQSDGSHDFTPFDFVPQPFYELYNQADSMPSQQPLRSSSADELGPANPFAQFSSLNYAQPSQNLDRASSAPNHPALEMTADPLLDEASLSPNTGPRVTVEDHDASHNAQAERVPGLIDLSNERSGIAPEGRGHLNQGEIASPNDQEQHRQLDEGRTRIQDWLDHGSCDNPQEAYQEDNQVTGPSARQGEPSSLQAKGLNAAGYQTSHQSPALPGPGAVLEVDEDASDDDFSDQDTVTSLPAAAEDLNNGKSFASTQHSSGEQILPPRVRPWTDSPVDQHTPDSNGQPPTSSAAISRFLQKARDVETASLTATLGSRRRSESDMGSLYGAEAVSRAPTGQTQHVTERTGSRSGLFERLIPRRNSINPKKRKDEVPQRPFIGLNDPKMDYRGNLSPGTAGTWSRPRSPKIDTNVGHHSKPVGLSPTNLSPLTASGPLDRARIILRRARSRTDLGSKSPGLADIWAQTGGPPTLKPPGSETQAGTPVDVPARNDSAADEGDASPDDDVVSSATVAMPLNIRDAPAAPTREGFQDHIVRLNDRLETYMINRITNEQVLRFKRLMDSRRKHTLLVSQGKCPSGARCAASGGLPNYFSLHNNGRGRENASVAFQVIQNSRRSETREFKDSNSMEPAFFPEGIPLPPVERLPAEFECPLCFQVKKFQKPSDWTKHVHEDVQPFTCTFPNCGEPKSFKRKADWVRHESERHRHLDKWICDVEDCRHECYRKDNFVQHLVREHKYPEPRVRSTKAAFKGFPAGTQENEIVSTLVDKCHHETTKKACEEPCRFCENQCTTWKKLRVHLAKHMEQISLPILGMLDEQRLQEAVRASTSNGGSNGASVASSRTSRDPSSTSRSPYPEQGSSLDHEIATQLPISATSLTAGSTYPPVSVPNLEVGMHNFPPGIFGTSNINAGPYSDTSLRPSSGASTPHNTFEAQSQSSRAASPYVAKTPDFPTGSLQPHPAAWTGLHQVQTNAQSPQNPTWTEPVISGSPTDARSFTGLPTATFEDSVGNLSLDQNGWSSQGQSSQIFPTTSSAGYDGQHHPSLHPVKGQHYSNPSSAASDIGNSPAEYFGGQHNATYPPQNWASAHQAQSQHQQQQQFEYFSY